MQRNRRRALPRTAQVGVVAVAAAAVDSLSFNVSAWRSIALHQISVTTLTPMLHPYLPSLRFLLSSGRTRVWRMRRNQICKLPHPPPYHQTARAWMVWTQRSPTSFVGPRLPAL